MLCCWSGRTYDRKFLLCTYATTDTCTSCCISSMFLMNYFFRYCITILLSVQGILAFLFIITGNILELIEFASFLIWIFYGTAMVALLILRKTKKDIPRPYMVILMTDTLQFILTWRLVSGSLMDSSVHHFRCNIPCNCTNHYRSLTAVFICSRIHSNRNSSVLLVYL